MEHQERNKQKKDHLKNMFLNQIQINEQMKIIILGRFAFAFLYGAHSSPLKFVLRLHDSFSYWYFYCQNRKMSVEEKDAYLDKILTNKRFLKILELQGINVEEIRADTIGKDQYNRFRNYHTF